MNKKERTILLESIEKANKLKEQELNLTLQESQKIKTADQYLLNDIDKLKAENERLKERDLTLTSYEKVLEELSKAVILTYDPIMLSTKIHINLDGIKPVSSAYFLTIMLKIKDDEEVKEYIHRLERKGISF